MVITDVSVSSDQAEVGDGEQFTILNDSSRDVYIASGNKAISGGGFLQPGESDGAIGDEGGTVQVKQGDMFGPTVQTFSVGD